MPLFCNQWGVKHLVPESLGRRQYVRDVANLFEVAIIIICDKTYHHKRRKQGGSNCVPVADHVCQDYGIHSTYWIWRSYHQDEWTGFEMVGLFRTNCLIVCSELN